MDRLYAAAARTKPQSGAETLGVEASGTLYLVAMPNTAGQWRAPIGWYGQHRRPVARSNWLIWPTPQAAADTALAMLLHPDAEPVRDQSAVLAQVLGQWHALIGVLYGQHRRPVARSS